MSVRVRVHACSHEHPNNMQKRMCNYLQEKKFIIYMDHPIYIYIHIMNTLTLELQKFGFNKYKSNDMFTAFFITIPQQILGDKLLLF